MPLSRRSALAKIVNANRANLIKWYSFGFSGTSKAAAESLTNIAINKMYIDERAVPPGNTLKQWVINQSAPQWACRAAFDYLVDVGWQPKNDTEKAIAARYLVLNNHSINEQWRSCLGDWLKVAIEAKEND